MVVGCHNSSPGINYKYGYCPKDQSIDLDGQEDIKNKKFSKIAFDKNALSVGAYEYEGSETLVRSEKNGKTFLIHTKESWTTPLGKTERVLAKSITCTRNPDLYKKNGFNFQYNEMTKLEIDAVSLKVSSQKQFHISFDPEALDDKLAYTSEDVESPQVLKSPKDYYQDKKHNFYQYGAASPDVFELRTEEKDGEFTITNIVRYKKKK
jgi:hypothetical protein